MEIDWFTVIAQILNFLLLVWLLKRFLYKPVLQAIDTREAGIAASLQEAQAAKEQAVREREELLLQRRSFEEKRAAAWSEAEEDIKNTKQREAAALYTGLEKLRTQQLKEMQKDMQRTVDKVAGRIQQEVMSTATQVLTELGGTSLDKQVQDVFVQRLQQLDEQAKTCLKEALQKPGCKVQVVSRSPVAAEEQQLIHSVLTEIGGIVPDMVFEQDVSLIGGVTLTAGDYRLSWNIAHYLSGLQQHIKNAMAGTTNENNV